MQKIKAVCNKIVSSGKFLIKVEKRYKLITYVSLLSLTYSTINMRKDLMATKIELATVKQDKNNLLVNIVFFNRNYENFPLPIWQKVKRNDRFIMQYVNPDYVHKFGHLFNHNKYSLFGKTNYDIFEKTIADNYFKNDLKVALTGKAELTTEFAVDSLGRKLNLKVLKWRDIVDKKDTLIYGMVKDIFYDK